jgi:D,D-heptose 1,7-bisphosphate phosphatase
MRQNILVIRFSSLGDIILTSATLQNLRINFPDSHIVFLTKPAFCPVVERFGTVDEIVTLPETTGSDSYYRFLLELDRRNFDIVVDLHGNMRSWLARKIISAARKVVYPKRRRERFRLVRQDDVKGSWPHTIGAYNDTISQLDGRIHCRRAVIQTRRSVEADRIRREAANRPLVLIAPGAAHENKQWPVERFAEVALMLNQRLDARLIWAVTRGDKSAASFDSKIPPEDVVELVDHPIDQLADIIGRADLSVCNDSGIAHLSSAVGTPTVAVFGPTHPALGFSPRGLFDRVVEVDEYCRPCSLHGRKPCFRQERFCFTRISPGMVFEQAAEMLNSRANSPAVFIDRDGTLVVDKEFLSDPDEIEFVDGSLEAVRLLKRLGLKVIVLSNQSGVARGYFNIDTVERVNAALLGKLAGADAEIDGLYYCPHLATGTVPQYSIVCQCRKPAPGMAEEAAQQLRIDLRQSFMIGDKLDDLYLGRVFGGQSFLVRTGYGRQHESILRARNEGDGVVFDNLLAVARYIEGNLFP